MLDTFLQMCTSLGKVQILRPIPFCQLNAPKPAVLLEGKGEREATRAQRLCSRGRGSIPSAQSLGPSSLGSAPGLPGAALGVEKTQRPAQAADSLASSCRQNLVGSQLSLLFN